MSDTQSGPTQTEEVLQYKPYLVTMRDGRKEQVFIRLLPLRDMPRKLELVKDLPATAELYCKQERGWADGITHKDVYAIVREGDRMNEVPFGEWLEEATAHGERLDRSAMRVLPRLSPSPATPPA